MEREKHPTQSVLPGFEENEPKADVFKALNIPHAEKASLEPINSQAEGPKPIEPESANDDTSDRDNAPRGYTHASYVSSKYD